MSHWVNPLVSWATELILKHWVPTNVIFVVLQSNQVSIIYLGGLRMIILYGFLESFPIPFIILWCYMPVPVVFSHDWTKTSHNLSSFIFFSFYQLLLPSVAESLSQGLWDQKMEGDKGQGQTVEKSLELLYNQLYLLEISQWSWGGNTTAKHLQYWKPGKCIPWKTGGK